MIDVKWVSVNDRRTLWRIPVYVVDTRLSVLRDSIKLKQVVVAFSTLKIVKTKRIKTRRIRKIGRTSSNDEFTTLRNVIFYAATTALFSAHKPPSTARATSEKTELTAARNIYVNTASSVCFSGQKKKKRKKNNKNKKPFDRRAEHPGRVSCADGTTIRRSWPMKPSRTRGGHGQTCQWWEHVMYFSNIK